MLCYLLLLCAPIPCLKLVRLSVSEGYLTAVMMTQHRSICDLMCL